MFVRWFSQSTDPGARASTWPLIAPYVDLVKDWLAAGVTVATIAQRSRDGYCGIGVIGAALDSNAFR